MVFTNNRKRPLLKCGFAHRMRGRVRITCRAVRYLRQEQDDLEAHFSELRGVLSLRMNCAASSVILQYDPGRTNDDRFFCPSIRSRRRFLLYAGSALRG